MHGRHWQKCPIHPLPNKKSYSLFDGCKQAADLFIHRGQAFVIASVPALEVFRGFPVMVDRLMGEVEAERLLSYVFTFCGSA